MAPAAGSDEAPEILYGLHAVREALRSGDRPLSRLLVVRQDRQFAALVRLARVAGVPVHREPQPVFDRLVPRGKHQGVIALVARKRYAELEEMLACARSRNETPFIVILDGVEDPHNLGAVLRSAEAAGVHGVLIPERRAVGLTGTVAKASAGALEHLLVGRAQNVSRLIEALQAEGLWVYGLDPQARKSYTALDLQGPVALVLGGEGKGIRPGVLEKCDDRASIPMRGRVASLNVSAAAAIVMFEAVHQRTR
ncbi:MAG: 23S rRNA (guanosine(2251)-2'-O)-methyltransferase RlmB [Nitrospirota bacterium]|nr:23S rRNA (guanosine(2251)-2'-O)-methyltransferase RlmB [Nitrospirota bacterium]